jgi:hypothetical protein
MKSVVELWTGPLFAVPAARPMMSLVGLDATDAAAASCGRSWLKAK